MNLSRRGFLSGVGAVLAGAVLDPERLLWVPGQRTFFIPDPKIVTARTMEDARRHITTVYWPDGFTTEVTDETVEHVYGGPVAYAARVQSLGGSFREWVKR